MTKKLCTAASCNAIVDHPNDGSSPRCPKHKSATRPKITAEERKRKYAHHYDDKGRNIYSTYRWKKLRAEKARLNPICEHCERNGRAIPVEEVDHIHELEDNGSFWDIDNLQSLCKRHHIIKTNKAKAERETEVDEFGYLKNTRRLKK